MSALDLSEPREIARYKRAGGEARYAMECHREYGAPWQDCYKALVHLTGGRTGVAWCAVEAARELRMDYTAVEFDGITYWVR